MNSWQDSVPILKPHSGGARGAGSCQPWHWFLPWLLLWRIHGVWGAGAVCRAWKQRGADFCSMTAGRGATRGYTGPYVQDGDHGLCSFSRTHGKRSSKREASLVQPVGCAWLSVPSYSRKLPHQCVSAGWGSDLVGRHRVRVAVPSTAVWLSRQC